MRQLWRVSDDDERGVLSLSVEFQLLGQQVVPIEFVLLGECSLD
jgi:hypothetical protein